ncbi:DUF6265 family protein [uncultured Maribacter sp.]|uniref:DUF6265 family protein n=1 Tax=uncultured Maribacter sp. TaxID=431308 RepID=UPI002602E3C0|nr:DUF6265 family protein [uncultured Maribacter sp.]
MKFITLLLLLSTLTTYSQNTIKLIEGEKSPKAKLSDVKWISGHWKGHAFGGTTEEIWSPPLGDSLMFVFKLVVNDKVLFYEIGHIQEKEGTLILQLKHFASDLKGWEAKEETVDFKLVKLEENKVFFEDFTVEKIGENEINIYVVIKDEHGTNKEERFNYKRQ